MAIKDIGGDTDDIYKTTHDNLFAVSHELFDAIEKNITSIDETHYDFLAELQQHANTLLVAISNKQSDIEKIYLELNVYFFNNRPGQGATQKARKEQEKLFPVTLLTKYLEYISEQINQLSAPAAPNSEEAELLQFKIEEILGNFNHELDRLLKKKPLAAKSTDEESPPSLARTNSIQAIAATNRNWHRQLSQSLFRLDSHLSDSSSDWPLSRSTSRDSNGSLLFTPIGRTSPAATSTPEETGTPSPRPGPRLP